MKTSYHLLISACLMGQLTRYDGSYKKTSPPFAWPKEITVLPVCPEVEMGLGVPREPMQLISAPSVQLETCTTKINQTQNFENWACRWKTLFPYPRIHGAILKERSPSCGLHTPLYNAEGKEVLGQTPGLFSLFLQKEFKGILLETEEVLKEISAWQKFLDQIMELT